MGDLIEYVRVQAPDLNVLRRDAVGRYSKVEPCVEYKCDGILAIWARREVAFRRTEGGEN